ncbi:hypothetical protein FIBSPDRAFT_932822 [Athelia psychrophila]|uniref:Uncharacterized protein n=1 Tax=Athelia psychrophila TaxID=1759441 RepID=A0A166I480_9AGAM|nr:hypothetical protein FIBSPDRAFT_932822 [Fibularhizoctonia sp. CBS 109695]
MSLLLAALLAIQCLSLAVAQPGTTIMSCTPVEKWELNQESQNPCYMFSAALFPCQTIGIGPPSVADVVLNLKGPYGGPSPADQNICQCSTVTYSLMAACTYCQNGVGWISWSEWSGGCTKTTLAISTYPAPIPNITSFPSWAYLNVTVAGTFDPSQAAAATGVESTAPSPTSSSSASSSSALGSSSTSPPNASSTSSPGAGASATTSGTGSSNTFTPISSQASAPMKLGAGMIAGAVVAVERGSHASAQRCGPATRTERLLGQPSTTLESTRTQQQSWHPSNLSLTTAVINVLGSRGSIHVPEPTDPTGSHTFMPGQYYPPHPRHYARAPITR